MKSNKKKSTNERKLHSLWANSTRTVMRCDYGYNSRAEMERTIHNSWNSINLICLTYDLGKRRRACVMGSRERG